MTSLAPPVVRCAPARQACWGTLCREFHQFGVEMLGSASPAADAEVIGVADEIFRTLGVKGLELQINSIGCPECRGKYHEALKAYFEARKGDLCETCLTRLEKNPMRILDCKSPVCSEIAKDEIGRAHV